MYVIERYDNDGIVKLKYGTFYGKVYEKNGKIILGYGKLVLTNLLSIIVNYEEKKPYDISFPNYTIPIHMSAQIGLLYKIQDLIKYQLNEFEIINSNLNEFIIISKLIYGNIQTNITFELVKLIRINNNFIKKELLNINNDDPINQYKWIFIGPETNILFNIIIHNDFIYDKEIDNIYDVSKYAILKDNIYKIILGIKVNDIILPIYILEYKKHLNKIESELDFLSEVTYYNKCKLFIDYGKKLYDKSIKYYINNLRS